MEVRLVREKNIEDSQQQEIQGILATKGGVSTRVSTEI